MAGYFFPKNHPMVNPSHPKGSSFYATIVPSPELKCTANKKYVPILHHIASIHCRTHMYIYIYMYMYKERISNEDSY